MLSFPSLTFYNRLHDAVFPLLGRFQLHGEGFAVAFFRVEDDAGTPVIRLYGYARSFLR